MEWSGQVLVKGMSNFAVLCARAVQADGYRCVAHFTACMTVHAQGVPIAIAHAIACASSECDKLIACALLILLYSSRSKKWSDHGLTGPTGSYAYDIFQISILAVCIRSERNMLTSKALDLHLQLLNGQRVPMSP